MPYVLLALCFPPAALAAGYHLRRAQMRRRGDFASIAEFAGRLQALGRR